MDRTRRITDKRGFTLVEIMIVVVIVGLLNFLAIPAINQVRYKATSTRIANDYRVFRIAFETYHFEQAEWPRSAAFGEIPRGMEDYLREAVWGERFQGARGWRWIRQGGRNNRRCFIQLRYRGRDTRTMMAQVDAILDDGDLSSGTFIRSGNNYRYILKDR